MNTLGKTLVFLNLIFSVLTGALIVMVFTTKTNWKSGYDRLSQAIQIERADKLKAVAEVEDKEAKLAKTVKDVQGQQDELAKKTAEAETKERAAVEKMNGANKRVADVNLTNEKHLATIETQRVEIKSLDDRMEERQQKVLKLEQDTRKLTQEKIKFEIDYQSAQDRNDKLAARLTEMAKEIETLRGVQADKSSQLTRNPPPEDVHGKVTQTDQTSGYVTINLGSDNGITKGNTLEVYRRQPRPTYVGVLRILEVKPHEAVGRLVQRNAAIQSGDEVASDILGKR
jgi:predicted nuclease with TOPRIM domain